MDTYGQRLGFALRETKKDRKGLAAAMGISVQAIGQVIRGGTGAFTSENNSKACTYLGVNPDWLATGEGDFLAKKHEADHSSGSFHDLEHTLIDLGRHLASMSEAGRKMAMLAITEFGEGRMSAASVAETLQTLLPKAHLGNDQHPPPAPSSGLFYACTDGK
jgi:transcriptional regulator with XRE-family HTH domain